METRTCRGCGGVFPATTEFFSRMIDKPGGLAYKCKPCRNAEVARHTKSYRDRIRSGGAKLGDSRKLYESLNGPIPDGYDVHHLDGDPSNNSAANLVAVTPLDHKRLHAGWIIENGEWKKPCSRCKEMLPIDNFYEHKKGSGRPESRCKKCSNKYPERECPFCGKTYTPCYADQKSCGRNCEGKKRK